MDKRGSVSTLQKVWNSTVASLMVVCRPSGAAAFMVFLVVFVCFTGLAIVHRLAFFCFWQGGGGFEGLALVVAVDAVSVDFFGDGSAPADDLKCVCFSCKDAAEAVGVAAE